MGTGKSEIVGTSDGRPDGRPVGNSVGIGWSVGGPAEGSPSEERSVGRTSVENCKGGSSVGKLIVGRSVGTAREADGKLAEGSSVGIPCVGRLSEGNSVGNCVGRLG